MATYAASRIKVSSGSEGGPAKYIEVGDTVSAKDLGGEEELEQAKAEGIVTEEKLPEDLGRNESLNQYRFRQLREGIALAAAQGSVAQLKDRGAKEVKEIPNTRVTQHTPGAGKTT